MSKAVLVVESPAKAKTINKYLGSDFTVLASYGHVRDLPSKDGSVRPDEDFAMTYQVDADSKKAVSAIAKALKGAENLYLATDPDREGEAISWHVLQALEENKALKKETNVSRVVFHEITKKAVTHAVANPRDIDMDLVNAQQARRALDYLVGFNLSPVLWRKLPGSRSAGRVQSVALRLVCEREAEIEAFKPEEFWSVTATFTNEENKSFEAKLTHFDGEKLEKFSIQNAERANQIQAALKANDYHIKSITPKTVKRNPYAPFTTSTLQMDASRKLGFSAKRTMQVAQKLYEGVDIGGETIGLITYMRTDGVTVSQEAINDARNHIGQKFGNNYLPKSPRMYKTKAKNAQEAHEAIRPTDITRTPEKMARALNDDMAKLYTLIYNRMLASQMEAAVFDQLAVDICNNAENATFRATGSTLKFDGFLTLYQEGKEDDDTSNDDDQRLPNLKESEKLATKDIVPNQHFTQAPPRYSEASLVKKLEELGIGRPSTFASIISVLLDRGYTNLEKKRFVATPLGRIVTAFLSTYFERYVQYDFTASLEERLDLIAEGKHDWKKELHEFWNAFSAQIEQSKELTITEVLEEVEKLLIPYLFGENADDDARKCPSCSDGKLGLKTGKFGAFLGCSNYPDCKYTKQLAAENDAQGEGEASADAQEFPITLGTDPESGEEVSLRKGPYGFYMQLGEGKKPKRTGIPKGSDPMSYDLKRALQLLSLPREVGEHPETGELIKAGIGRYGPYLFYQSKYITLPKEDDVLSVGMNRAVTIIAEKANGAKGGATKTVLKNLGKHPETGDALEILKGRYGPYIKYQGSNVSLPRDADVGEFLLEDAITLLANAPAKKGTKKKAASKKKPAAKKTTTKKTTAKKA